MVLNEKLTIAWYFMIKSDRPSDGWRRIPHPSSPLRYLTLFNASTGLRRNTSTFLPSCALLLCWLWMSIRICRDRSFAQQPPQSGVRGLKQILLCPYLPLHFDESVLSATVWLDGSWFCPKHTPGVELIETADAMAGWQHSKTEHSHSSFAHQSPGLVSAMRQRS